MDLVLGLVLIPVDQEPMDQKIEERLAHPDTSSQGSLRGFVKDVQALIGDYEQQLYEDGEADPAGLARVKRWRARCLAIVRANKTQPAENKGFDEAGVETLKLVHRQIQFADTNQRLLDRGTLKLVGLDYSCGDIEKAIAETRKKVQAGKSKERREKRNLLLGFIFFVAVCLFIVVDKLRMRFL